MLENKIITEMNGGSEEKKDVEEKLDAHDMERSWRMGRFMEDTGLEDEGGRNDGLPVRIIDLGYGMRILIRR